MGAFGDSAAMVYVPPLVPQWNEMQKIFDDNLGPVSRARPMSAPR
jgi:multiple sugar transport system substrate-binding protein